MNLSREQVKAARALLGFTSADLARRAAIAQSTVTAIENGRFPQGAAIARIQAVFEAAGVEFKNGKQSGVGMKERRGGATIAGGDLNSENET